jgi:alpha-L-rhamnosidase
MAETAMSKPDAKRDFAGQWITNERFCEVVPRNVFHRQLDKSSSVPRDPERENRHVLFRRRFSLEQTAKTVVYITADDVYKLYINGTFVTQGPCPGYSFHYFYNTVDISDYVKVGENVIAVHTYYQGLINRVWVSGDGQHGLLLDVCANGNTVLKSDDTFLCREHSAFSAVGIAGYDTQFLERYDAAAPEVGFEKPGFDDASWESARPRRHAAYDLFPQPSRRLEFEAIAPVEVKRRADRWLIDFGGIFVGSLAMNVTGTRGDEVVMRFAQELNDDGTPRHGLRANCDYVEYMRLSGGADQLNQFDYKSFRYVEIECPENCRLDEPSIVLHARHYPFELKAECKYNDEASLAIWDLCVNTLRYGVQEFIQDCMEREKGYYLGDGCYSLLTFCLLTRDYTVMEKFFDDFLRTAFVNRGLMTCSSCSFMQEIAEYPLIMFTTLLEYCYLVGDYDFVRERYAAFVDVLDFYAEQYAEPDGLLNNLDKWCVVEWPDNMRDGYDVDLTEGQVCRTKHNVINAYYLGAIKCLNKVADLIGESPYKTPDAMHRLESSFVNAFYDGERHLFRDSVSSSHISMAGNALAWLFDLFPDATGVETFKAMVRKKRLSQSSFFVTFPLLCALLRDGEEELVHDLLTDENAWLRMLSEGATRTFEGWGKDLKWNTSLFHLTMSYGAAFMTSDFSVKEIFAFRRAAPMLRAHR